jgi:hypothetical protein
MELMQLTGKHLRLQWELEAAYSKLPWETARIDRLTNDLAVTERQIAALRSGDPMPRRHLDQGLSAGQSSA